MHCIQTLTFTVAQNVIGRLGEQAVNEWQTNIGSPAIFNWKALSVYPWYICGRSEVTVRDNSNNFSISNAILKAKITITADQPLTNIEITTFMSKLKVY